MTLLRTISIFALVAFLANCASTTPETAKAPVTNEPAPAAAQPAVAQPTQEPAPVAASTTDPAADALNALRSALDAKDAAGNPALANVFYFPFDSSNIEPATASKIDVLVPYIVNAIGLNQTLVFRLDGYADNRGTAEYNLALGARRGEAVSRYLRVKANVPASSLVVTSYGEEKPAAMGDNEAAWALNRRVQFNIQ